MTRRLGAVGITMWLFACVAVGAAEVWESKPFNTWTADELKKVLTNSPWAGKGGVTYTRARGASSQPIEDSAIITWNSALPMRQALAREQLGVMTEVPKEVDAFLAETPGIYVVSLKISGGMGSSGYAAQVAAIQKETFLLRDDKDPIPAIQAEGRVLDKDGKVVEMPAPGARRGGAAPGGAPPAGGGAPQFSALPGAAAPQRGGGGGGGAPPGGGFGGGRGFGGGVPGGSSVLVFGFLRTDPIVLADKEVEFATKVGQYTVKRKFKLKDMVFKGELGL
jgi:hypothetical protein